MGSGWPEATLYLRIALISMCIGYLLFLIGFSTDYWQVGNHEGSPQMFGLWVVRVHSHPGDYTGIVSALTTPMRIYTQDWFRATQVLECFGLISITIALLVLVLYFFVPSCKQRRVLFAVICFTFASVALIITGAVIIGAEMGYLGYSVGWSMALAIVGACLAMLSAVVEVLEYVR